MSGFRVGAGPELRQVSLPWGRLRHPFADGSRGWGLGLVRPYTPSPAPGVLARKTGDEAQMMCKR